MTNTENGWQDPLAGIGQWWDESLKWWGGIGEGVTGWFTGNWWIFAIIAIVVLLVILR